MKTIQTRVEKLKRHGRNGVAGVFIVKNQIKMSDLLSWFNTDPVKQQEKPVNTVWQKLLVRAVDENDGKRDLAVAVDGSWQKRGFSSKNGLVTVTSVDTGKVIDVEVFFKTLYLSEQNQASSKL
ncbi:hypothetical protein TNCV_873891 [Trichonephila clavipes]|nr:hypothetical protein TNCV_873891 [Trichonephila clavipes]